MIYTVQQHIESLLKDGNNHAEIANMLGVSSSMISQYKGGYNASLDVAITVYKGCGKVLHPFSQESIKHEMSK